MGLKGYCPNCKILVVMTNIQTIRLANKQYVQRGYCSICAGEITKAIPDAEILVVPPGHYFPKTVYVGEDTPAKIIKDHNGQQIIDGSNILLTQVRDDVKTLAQIEEEQNAGQNNLSADN